jgi:hypothetical protein
MYPMYFDFPGVDPRGKLSVVKCGYEYSAEQGWTAVHASLLAFGLTGLYLTIPLQCCIQREWEIEYKVRVSRPRKTP